MPRKNPKKQKEIEFYDTTYRGRSAKLARKSLLPRDDAWQRGEGRQLQHGRQSPGSLKG